MDCDHQFRRLTENGSLYCSNCDKLLVKGLQEQSDLSKAIVIILVLFSLYLSFTILLG